jgi:hypothetical protein
MLVFYLFSDMTDNEKKRAVLTISRSANKLGIWRIRDAIDK